MPELMFLSVLKMIMTNKVDRASSSYSAQCCLLFLFLLWLVLFMQKKISVYLVLLEGETLAFHGSHLSHEGRKSVHTTPSQVLSQLLVAFYIFSQS